MEAYKRKCPLCGGTAELGMSKAGGSTPKVDYHCTECGRPFSLLPGTVRKVLAVSVMLSAPVVAGGILVLMLDTGTTREVKALRLVIPGLFVFLASAIALVRDGMIRRAAPVISRF